MLTTRHSCALTLALALLAAAPASAQEPPPPPGLATWAPKWKKGDWWVVKTYQRDLSERLTSPEPAEGATPRVPDDPRTEPLPGLPPGGVPEGWKVANSFRFEVVRRELVKYPDDGPNDAPEAFAVVLMSSLEGRPIRTAELWFTESDLTLAKVVESPGTPNARAHELSGKVLLDPAVSSALGFPLDWPDFIAATQPSADLPIEGRGVVEQRVRAQGEEVQVRLGLKSDTNGESRGRVLITWRANMPFWSRLVGPLYLAELVESGRAR
jgi:hypothetical protein